MQKSKFTAYILLAAMLASLASCGSQTSSSGDTTTAADTTTEQVEESKKGLLYTTTDDEIAKLGLNGYEFNIFERRPTSSWLVEDLVAEEANGEVLNDAIYNRYTALQDKFGFTMKITHSGDEYAGELSTYVLAGDDTYDIAFPMISKAASFAQQGVLCDLYSLDYFDIDSGVWSKMFCDEIEWQGKLYFASGNISINAYKSIRAFMFNKDIHTEYKFDNLYDTVRDGKWTLDTVKKLATAVAKDLNGDAAMTTMEDQWGMAWQSSISGLSMFYGADARITEKGADGIPTLTLGNSHSQDVFEKISSMMSDTNVFHLSSDADMKNTFMEGRSYLYTEVLRTTELMRDSKVDFGIIPIPKYDEKQAEYIQFTDDWCASPVVVPINAKNLSRCGFLVQLLAETGKEYIKPAYYDVCLTNKYARDEDSVEMLDIIVNNFRLDNAVLYKWGGLFSQLVTSFSDGTGLSSLVASNKSVIEEAIAKTTTEMAANAK